MKTSEVDSVIFANAKNEHLSNGMIVGGLGAALVGAVIAIVGIFIRKGEALYADEPDREFNNVGIEEVKEFHARVTD